MDLLEAALDDPTQGLPQEVFYFMSRITPLVNVDLLVRDSRGRTLLAWRDDPYAGKGWHIPGGIVRFKESLLDRVTATVRDEIGRDLDIDPVPVQSNQLWKKQDTRGHFVSFLYLCTPREDFEPDNTGRSPGDSGFLAWHEGSPDDLIIVHDRIYRDVINNPAPQPYCAAPIPTDYFEKIR